MKLPIIAALRSERHLTQQEIADALNVPKRTYAAWERGENDFPIDVLIALADFYGVTVDYLLGRVPMDVVVKNEKPPAQAEGEERVSVTIPDDLPQPVLDARLAEFVRQIVNQELTKKKL